MFTCGFVRSNFSLDMLGSLFDFLAFRHSGTAFLNSFYNVRVPF